MLVIKPCTLKQANFLVAQLHRHHKPCQGHRFSISVWRDNICCGCAIVGRPVARGFDPYLTAEVTRLVTDGTKNACSILYSSAARACQAMGFKTIGTYILENEPGTTLKAAGWSFSHKTPGGDWNSSKQYKGKRRTDQPQGPKQYWYKQLN